MRANATVVLAAMVLGLLLPGRLQGQTKPVTVPVAPKVHRGDGWSIAAPEDWGVLADVEPPMALHLIGDGRAGVPMLDGSLSAIKAGLQVHQYRNRYLSLKEVIDRDVKSLKEAGAFEILAGPNVKEVVLRDGTKATLVKAEFIRQASGRLSISQKLYCNDVAGQPLVVTGFISCNPSGVSFVKLVRLPEFVEAHVMSLVLDRGLEQLKGVYEKHDWKAGEAIVIARDAYRMLQTENYPAAINGFREALKICPYLQAAHNGLAWSLLKPKDAPREDLQEALTTAKKAVELTEGKDFTSLDTLALAYFRNGQKDQAITTIQQALKLQPDHPDLVARLKSFETAN